MGTSQKEKSDGVARDIELWRAFSAMCYEDRRDKTSLKELNRNLTHIAKEPFIMHLEERMMRR